MVILSNGRMRQGRPMAALNTESESPNPSMQGVGFDTFDTNDNKMFGFQTSPV